MWRNLKFHHMWIISHDKCGEIWNFSTCGVIWNVSTWQMWRNLKSPSLSAICVVSSGNRFVAIYALLRGENLSQKLCPWRKNYKYEVWWHWGFSEKAAELKIRQTCISYGWVWLCFESWQLLINVYRRFAKWYQCRQTSQNPSGPGHVSTGDKFTLVNLQRSICGTFSNWIYP